MGAAVAMPGVLGALNALLGGLQGAAGVAPDQVYEGLVTTLLRVVFVLSAEERGLLPERAIGSLFDELREEAARDAAGMEARYGAWGRLLALFREIHGGSPPRGGRLFDPASFAFLEGTARPSDGVVLRVLEALLLAGGERRSYGALDVEQLGGVYEGLIGLRVVRVREASIAVRGRRKPGDRVLGLESLLAVEGAKRAEHLKRRFDLDVSGTALGEASSIDALVAALGRRISPLTPRVLPAGALALEATEERRRSGSHYTPRALTEAIVEKTLRPVLGERPAPEEILAVKVCDPAMGSGAFLVAACRLLGDALVQAWERRGTPAGGDPTRLARRLVAQRCLYGVDLNPIAVELAKLSLWLVARASEHRFTFADHGLRCGDSLVGFDWEAELPEVFARPNGGFDAVVGNPPFAGKNTLRATRGEVYLDRLKALHQGAHGNADLVAHFFRRAFTLLREGGTLGLIATNTVAQGDTRATGLRWIVEHGGVIYDATRRCEWPAEAAVIVSVVHVAKAPSRPLAVHLDGVPVDRVSAFLFHTGPDADPVPLRANRNRSFQGPIVLGMGFTFDDDNPDATPLAEMHRLIANDPRNRERILPYLGGDELNTSPSHAHHRHVIDFGQMSEEEARRWPDLLAIVEAKVKPERLRNHREAYRRCWWQFAEKRVELFEAVRGLDRVLVVPFVAKWHAPAFVPSSTVVAGPANVLAIRSMAGFAAVQSRPHEIWARFFGSSMEDRPRYTPSDCFEPFPFPPRWEDDPRLEAAGRAYHDFRAALMARTGRGLTQTYNRFHDPGERDEDVLHLRELHGRIDRAVLDAYGWRDLHPTCEFLLEHAHAAARGKPWRYRWPDAARDEVLARLLALNAARAADEA